MSRRISTKKRFPERDFRYNSLLVSILINRILKNGKKQLATRIVHKALQLVEQRIKKNPLLIVEKAIKNVTPTVQLKSKRLAGSTHQIPALLSRFRSTNLATCWMIEAAKKRSAKGMILNLANELIDASKGIGAAVKKKDETHRMAEANKAFATDSNSSEDEDDYDENPFESEY